MSYQTTFNWSTGNYTLPENFTLVRITGAGAGTATLTLPVVTGSFISFDYSIYIVDTNNYVNGLTIIPNPSDTGFLINGGASFIWESSNSGL